jgi:hypothetical protein
MITQISINQQNKSFSSLQGKSRLDSLIDRIQSANKEINTILETPIQTKKEEKTQKEIDESKKEEKPLKTLDQKIVENDNNKSVQVGLDDNENNQEINENKKDNKDNNTLNQDNQENPENPETQINNNNDNQNQEQEKKNINLDVEIPFVKKIKKMLNELKIMKEKPEITEEEINNNVSELPKRAMVEMSLSDFKIKKKYESIKKQLDEKNNYIKKLENEIVNQRILNNNLKKLEGEHLLKISALEDELRVMKLKLLGYNTSEELNIHNHQQYKTDANNCGHIYGEKLVHSMWVRGNNTPNNNINNNNFDLDNSRPILNKGERWRAPWISQSQGNINRMVMRNINKNLYNNENIHTRTENKLGYEIGEKNNFDINNDRYESFKSNNNNFSSGGNNVQRVSGMILENSNKMKLTKNFSNEFNRFRIGNNNNDIMNKNTNSNNSYFK